MPTHYKPAAAAGVNHVKLERIPLSGGSMIDIRPMTLDDFDALCVLLEEIHAYHVEGVPHIFRMPQGPVIRHDVFAEKLGDPDQLFLLAFDGSAVIGFLWAIIRPYDDTDTTIARRMLFVETLGIGERYRGQGVGRDLMARAEAWGRARGANAAGLTVWTFNQAAIGFYERLGYESELIRMVKPLDT